MGEKNSKQKEFVSSWSLCNDIQFPGAMLISRTELNPNTVGAHRFITVDGKKYKVTIEPA